MTQGWFPAKEEFDPNLSKEDWMSVISDRSLCEEKWLHILARFYEYGKEAACSEIEDFYDETPKSFNMSMVLFAKRLVSVGLCEMMRRPNDRNSYWVIPFVGRLSNKDELGSYIWKLRDELHEALEEFDVVSWDQEYLLRKLVNDYKTLIEKTNYTDFIDNELYKWKFISDNQIAGPLEIIDYLIDNNLNLYDRARDTKSWTTLKNDNPVGLENEINKLRDESVSLHERLSEFKTGMIKLFSGYSFNSYANDERTAACFLSCWYPQKYTLYKDGNLYEPLCSYLGVEKKTAGEKYEHFLEIANVLSKIVMNDSDLQTVFAEKTKGFIQSNMLIAQTVIWCVFSSKGREILDGNTRNYWACSFNTDTESKTSSFNDKGYWEVAYKYKNANKEAKQAWSNLEKVKVGDYLAFKHYDPHDKTIAVCYLGEVTKIDLDNGVIEVNRLPSSNYYKGKAPKLKKGTWNGYLVPVTGQNTINTIFNTDKEEAIMIPEKISEYGSVITSKKNVILQGAPGTGKTYSTAALALYVIGQKEPEAISNLNFNDHSAVMERYENYRNKNQIAFCTFHQSMDYEDFVEGLRPEIVNDSSSVIYNVRPGIFKSICDEASNSITDRVDNFDDVWNQLIGLLNEDEYLMIPLLSNKREIRIELNDYGTGLTERTYVDGDSNKGKIEGHSKFFSKEQVYNIYRDMPGIPSGGHDNYRKAIVAYMKQNLGLKDYVAGNGDVESKNYVLIIDEINRGYVSKIFGELITLLEKDKRIGAEHPIEVKLPYSHEDFGVPSNLYIIGTMNTTDRTTGTLDYALRRRFDFITLEADPSVLDSSVPEARTLFEDVKAFIEDKKLDDMDISDLMVGHSYFMAYDQTELKNRIRYEVIPLVKEYIKDGILNCLPGEADDFFKDWMSLKPHKTLPNEIN